MISENDLQEKATSDFDYFKSANSNDNFDLKRLENMKLLIDSLSKNLHLNKSILYVLMFIAGSETNPEVSHFAKLRTFNFEGYEHPEQIGDNPNELITKDLSILDRAFKYALREKSFFLLDYILSQAEKNYINVSIWDEQILDLLDDLSDPLNQKILKMLTKKDITLLNEFGKPDSGGNMSVLVDAKMQNKYSFEESLDISNFDKSRRELVVNRSSNHSKDRVSNQEKKNKIKKKRNPFNKFLDKADIVEIAIRAPHISDDEEVKVIVLLYEQLAIPTNETVTLFKLLIYYEQLQTFEMLLKHRMKISNVESMKRQITEETKQEIVLGRNDDDDIYDYDEIVSDAFSYAISMNKLHIAFYLYKTYQDDVYGNKINCIKSILNSFKNDETQINQVMYLEERLFILEKFMEFIEYKLALDFLTSIHEDICDDPNINFLVYCPNPLKIIAMLLNITIFLSEKHLNLKFKAQKVRSSLCDIANGIIDTCNSMNEIKDMLLDKTYTKIEIIDIIENLDLIEILQNPMVDSIVSNMYNGPFEREAIFKKSTWYKVFSEQIFNKPGSEALVSRSFKLLGVNHNFRGFAKYFKSQTRIFRSFIKNKSK